MKSLRDVPARMEYGGPDGTVAEPTLELLEEIIFRKPGKYWQQRNGESSLGMVRRIRKATAVAEAPALMFYLVPKHGFFFLMFEPVSEFDVRQWVPFAGGGSKPWVKHFAGQPFYAPRACFVSKPFAWEIVQEYLRSMQRSNCVRWVDRFELDFPNVEAGETAPSGSDLA